MVLEKTLENPVNSKEINKSMLKEINPEYSLEGLMLKLQYFGHLMQRAGSSEKTLEENWLIGKAGKDRREQEKRAAEDEMVRYHHQSNEHKSEQTPGDSEGQGSLACCSPWVAESDTTDWTTTIAFNFYSQQTPILPSKDSETVKNLDRGQGDTQSTCSEP